MNYTFSQIAAYATVYAHRHSITVDTIRDHVQSIGGTFRVSYDSDLGLEVTNTQFIIYLPWHQGILRDNFTIAHELGHFLLHTQGTGKPVKIGRFEDNVQEKQANRFAGALLLPPSCINLSAAECSVKYGLREEVCRAYIECIKRQNESVAELADNIVNATDQPLDITTDQLWGIYDD